MASEAIQDAFKGLKEGSITIPTPTEQPIAYLVTFVLLILTWSISSGSKVKAPLVNQPSKMRLFSTGITREEFAANTMKWHIEGHQKYADQPFRLRTFFNEVVVLSPKFINELKNESALDFQSATTKHFHSHLPGWEPFQANYDLPKIINRYLTKTLNKITRELSTEAELALQDQFGDSTEWHQSIPAADLLRVVSRVSTRIFMGEELSHNDEWLTASSKYAGVAFGALEELRGWPMWLKPLPNMLLPKYRAVKAHLDVCRKILAPVVATRNAEKVAAIKAGKPMPNYDDSLEWFAKENQKQDPATLQITLSVVAIHTTTELLGETMIRIAEHPELFPILRQEMIDVLGKEGLKKTAFYNLKIMDSVIKEAQRLKPVNISNMIRRTVKPLTLSNGLYIPANQTIWVDITHMWSPDVWGPNADQFDPYRFSRLRDDKATEHMAHLVSTSAEHMGFGHGEHACPGRFFAANEIKILLCHLLLKYDWKLTQPSQWFANGFMLVRDPSTSLMIKRREAEMDLSSLAC